MAIYGIGAYYTDQNHDASHDFKKHNIIGIGWDIHDAPDLHEYIRSLENDDIIYIKAAAFGSPTTVKAIGIIEGQTILSGNFGQTYICIGRCVKWLDTSTFKLPVLPGKNNVRTNSLYRETHPDHIDTIMNRIQNAIAKLI